MADVGKKELEGRRRKRLKWDEKGRNAGEKRPEAVAIAGDVRYNEEAGRLRENALASFQCARRAHVLMGESP